MNTRSILQYIVIFYGHLVEFVVIWYIFPVLVFCTKKNLATLQSRGELEILETSCQQDAKVSMLH
jgi:hypothetical protein